MIQDLFRILKQKRPSLLLEQNISKERLEDNVEKAFSLIDELKYKSESFVLSDKEHIPFFDYEYKIVKEIESSLNGLFKFLWFDDFGNTVAFGSTIRRVFENIGIELDKNQGLFITRGFFISRSEENSSKYIIKKRGESREAIYQGDLPMIWIPISYKGMPYEIYPERNVLLKTFIEIGKFNEKRD